MGYLQAGQGKKPSLARAQESAVPGGRGRWWRWEGHIQAYPRGSLGTRVPSPGPSRPGPPPLAPCSGAR